MIWLFEKINNKKNRKNATQHRVKIIAWFSPTWKILRISLWFVPFLLNYVLNLATILAHNRWH